MPFGWGDRLPLGSGTIGPLSSFSLCARPLSAQSGAPLCDLITPFVAPAVPAAFALYSLGRLVDVLGGDSTAGLLPPGPGTPLTLVRNPYVLVGSTAWGADGAATDTSASTADSDSESGFIPPAADWTAYPFISLQGVGCFHAESVDPTTCGADVRPPACPVIHRPEGRSLRIHDLGGGDASPSAPCALSFESGFSGEAVTTYGAVTATLPTTLAAEQTLGDSVMYLQDGAAGLKVFFNASDSAAAAGAPLMPGARVGPPGPGARVSVSGTVRGSQEEVGCGEFGLYVYGASRCRDDK